MENKVLKTINSRVSVRKYNDKKVSLKKLEAVLEAGQMAPSGMNRQICSILALRNKRYVEALRKLGQDLKGRDCFYCRWNSNGRRWISRSSVCTFRCKEYW